MQRVSDLVGKPIVTADRGERVGTVSDVLVDAHDRRVLGVVVGGGLFSSEQVLPFSEIQAVGSDAVVAKSQQGIVGARAWREGGAEAARTSAIRNKQVITKAGRQLGAVKDVYLDEQNGRVEAYEVSGGAFGGLIARKAMLPESADVTVGPDAIVVTEDAARQIESPSAHPRTE